MFAPVICVSALLLASCASRPARAPDCDKPYASTLMHCKRAQAAPDRSDQIEVCEVWGSYRRCAWVDRSVIERQLEQIIR